MESRQNEIRRIFGILFICVAIAVTIASVTNEILFLNNFPNYLYVIAWIVSFGIIFGFYFSYFKEKIPFIKNRMKNSLSWSLHIKIINGCCWAAPFVLIGIFPQYFQYLILLGIGLGNFSTYIFMKIFSNQNNKEQLLIGLTALLAIPIALEIDTSIFVSNQDISVLLSRILISISYAIGGIFALYSKTN
jgi:membrane protease YdiL (CAAX protease family)